MESILLVLAPKIFLGLIAAIIFIPLILGAVIFPIVKIFLFFSEIDDNISSLFTKPKTVEELREEWWKETKKSIERDIS